MSPIREEKERYSVQTDCQLGKIGMDSEKKIVKGRTVFSS